MPPVKLFFCVILLAGFLRLILSGNLNIALVLGVIGWVSGVTTAFPPKNRT